MTSKMTILAVFLLHSGPAFAACTDEQKAAHKMRVALLDGKERQVQALLEEGSDPNWTDKYGHAALFHARSKAMVDLLVEHGAHVNQPSAEPCKRGFSYEKSWPIHTMSYGDRTEVMAALLTHGADPDVRGDGWFPSAVATATDADDWDTTLRVLLDAGADPDVTDRNGNYAVHLAVIDGLQGALELLLANDANPNVQNADTETPLHLAVSTHNATAIPILLAAGADPNVATEHGVTAAEFATDLPPDVMALLTPTPLDPALAAALSAGDANAMAAAIDSGVSIRGVDERGRSALHIAAANDDAGSVSLLLAAGATPQAADFDGFTAVDHGAAAGSLLVLTLLLDRQLATVDDLVDRAARADQVEVIRLAASRGFQPTEPPRLEYTAASVVALLDLGAPISGPGSSSDGTPDLGRMAVFTLYGSKGTIPRYTYAIETNAWPENRIASEYWDQLHRLADALESGPQAVAQVPVGGYIPRLAKAAEGPQGPWLATVLRLLHRAWETEPGPSYDLTYTQGTTTTVSYQDSEYVDGGRWDTIVTEEVEGVSSIETTTIEGGGDAAAYRAAVTKLEALYERRPQAP